MIVIVLPVSDLATATQEKIQVKNTLVPEVPWRVEDEVSKKIKA